jgi:hypothetical protein
LRIWLTNASCSATRGLSQPKRCEVNVNSLNSLLHCMEVITTDAQGLGGLPCCHAVATTHTLRESKLSCLKHSGFSWAILRPLVCYACDASTPNALPARAHSYSTRHDRKVVAK